MLHSFETIEAAVANGTASEEVIRRIMGETIGLVTGRKPYDPLIAEFLDQCLVGSAGRSKERLSPVTSRFFGI
jgi:hypothetical protein